MADGVLFLLIICLGPFVAYGPLVILVWGFIAWWMVSRTYGWCVRCIRRRRIVAIDWESVRFAPIFVACTAVAVMEAVKVFR